jgi:hypothetical protein
VSFAIKWKLPFWAPLTLEEEGGGALRRLQEKNDKLSGVNIGDKVAALSNNILTGYFAMFRFE